MGSLRNTIRDERDGEAPVGLVGIGDAICHTDPVLALGLSFSLIHARCLAQAISDYPDDVDAAGRAYAAAIRPETEERYAQATDLDAARSRRWAGEPVDIAHRDGGAYEVFAIVAGYLAGTVDPDVFRAVARRHTFLDPVGLLNRDAVTLSRIEALFAELTAVPRPRPGPEREELVELVGRSAPTPP
jgi:hypothetical protein